MTRTWRHSEQQAEIDAQVDRLLAKSAAFRSLPLAEQASIRKNTASVVRTMAENRLAQGRRRPDPYAVPLEGPVGGIPLPGLPGGGGTTQPAPFTGGATQRPENQIGPKELGDFGTGIAVGVAQAGELLRQVNFPAFVAELIRGVFNAVVDASIQQMKAYGELVQSVAMSLNDFRDANVSENQGRDHLVSKYPDLMQINVVEGQPRVGVRPDADTSELPDFKSAFGLDDDITDLDDETIEDQLVPAARNDLARSRQSLLATMVLMGINRIVVTDGKINAKLKFDFRATDTGTKHAQKFDYQEFAPIHTEQKVSEGNTETGADYKKEGGWWGAEQGTSKRWTKDTTQIVDTPVIQVTGITDTTNTAQLEASAKLSGEVSLNFKSETFDLNKLASADEVFRLERVRSAGRGAPAPGGSGSPTNGKTAGNGAAPPDGQAAAGNTPAAAAPAPGA
jgi:hypothetical protein